VGSLSCSRDRDQGRGEPTCASIRADFGTRRQLPHQPAQRPQPGSIQHRPQTRLDDTQHISGIAADRSRRTVGQIDHQQQHAVPPLERLRRQQPTEQRVRLGHHPHLTRQHRTQLLQSDAFTPGTGKTHLAIGLAIRACQAGHRVLFATAADWVSSLAEAHHAGKLQAELVRLGRYPLLVIDEVGYIPFEPEAANLFFQLVSSRYERASLIVTSNKQFGRWGEVFGDDVVAAAMIDRLVHHAEVIATNGTQSCS
jgi:hypothetical protein